MQKITIAEAVKLVKTSESTIRRDIRKGKLSAEKAQDGYIRIDPAELARVYPMTTPPDTQADRQLTTTDNHKVVALLETQVQDLKAQLETATAEKAQLLTLLEREQQRHLPPSERRSWILRLIGAR